MIPVHENCGGRVKSELRLPAGVLQWTCDICGDIKDLFRQVIVPDESARQKYISRIERDKFEKMICERIINRYYPHLVAQE